MRDVRVWQLQKEEKTGVVGAKGLVHMSGRGFAASAVGVLAWRTGVASDRQDTEKGSEEALACMQGFVPIRDVQLKLVLVVTAEQLFRRAGTTKSTAKSSREGLTNAEGARLLTQASPG